MQTWGFAISFATCQPGNRSEYIHGGGGATQPAAGLMPKASAQRYGTIDATSVLLGDRLYKNSSGDEIANVNFFYNIAHVEASAYAH